MNSSKRRKILFLSAWYPNRYDAMSGLFVRKHADCVSRFAEVIVLYPCPTQNNDETGIVERRYNNVREIYVYYHHANNKIGKAIAYFSAFFRGFRFVENHYGRPDICHVNILTRVGVCALVLQMLYGIPYVITEHWTRYLPENNSYHGLLRKLCTKFVVVKAKSISTVSEMLEKAMKLHGLRNNYVHLNNVVDDFFFNDQLKKPSQKKQILLVSCFNEPAKNVCGIVRTIKRLSQRRKDFVLTIVGDGKDFLQVKEYAASLNLTSDEVQFVGEKTPEVVSTYFHQCDFSILFSNYETASIVIMESLASGRPIVTTNVGIVPEVITKENGIIVPPQDEDAFFQAISRMLDTYSSYSSEVVRDSAKPYSYDAVAKQLQNLYSFAKSSPISFPKRKN